MSALLLTFAEEGKPIGLPIVAHQVYVAAWVSYLTRLLLGE